MVHSTIVGERYLVTVMQGILCPLFKRVDFSDIKENIPIDKMMQEVISCAIIEICNEKFDIKPEIFQYFNLDKDLLVSLAVLEPVTNLDLI